MNSNVKVNTKRDSIRLCEKSDCLSLSDNGYDGLLKFTSKLQSNLGVYQGAESLLGFTKTLDDVYARFNVLENVDIAKINISQVTENITKLQESLGVSKAFSGMQNINKLYSVRLSSMLEKYTNLESLKGFREISKLFQEYDFEKIGNAYQNVLGQVDWTKDVSVEEIAEDVAEHYIAECSEDNKEIDKIVSSSESKENRKKNTRDDIRFFIEVVTFLLLVGGLVFPKPQVVNNTYNNTIEVNNYYTIETGMDAQLLNAMGCRIINENNVMPRVKPDCSSRVTGHLYIGQVVSVSDKWKKWIEINWTDSEGNYCTGWIQNYKVTEFK
ncbi:MAG: hypothetical protein E7259_01125 [Lachnospiraceae bacterium]|nr:hypothetical protein [Lachnospiraceae bacterium]